MGAAGSDAVIRATFWNVADASTDTGAGGDTVLTGGGSDYVFTGAGSADSLGSDFVDAGAGGTYFNVLVGGDSLVIGVDSASSVVSGNVIYTGGLGADTIGVGALSDTVLTVMRNAGAIAADTIGDFVYAGLSADFVVTGAGDDEVDLGAASTLAGVGFMGDSAMTGGGHDSVVSGSGNDSVVTAFVDEIAVSARGTFGSRYLDLTRLEASYAGIKAGDLVTGPYIPPNTRVASVSNKAVELTQELFHPAIANIGDSLLNGFRDTVATNDTITYVATGATMAFASFGANLRFWSVSHLLDDAENDSIVVSGGSDFVLSGTGSDVVDLSGGLDAGLSTLSTLSAQAWADSIADSNSIGTGFDLNLGVYTRGNYFLSAGGADSVLGGNFADTIVTYIYDASSDTLGDTIKSGDDADFIQTGVGNDFILFGDIPRPLGGGVVLEASSRSYAFNPAGAGLGDASGRGTSGNFISSGGGKDTISHGLVDEFYPERSDTVSGGNLADTVMTFGGKSSELSSLPGYWMRVRSQGIVPKLDYLNDTVGDSVESGGGGDYVFSGKGDDKLVFGGSIVIDAGKLNRVNSGGGRDTLIGGEGDDRVESFVGAEASVDAFGDIVDLRGGNDTVSLGVGNDFVQLGGGNDYAFISKGVDTVVGGDGDDEVQGNPDGVLTRGDSILGGAGADRIRLVASGVASSAVVTLRLGEGDEHLSVNYRAFIDLGPGVLQSVDARLAPSSITVIGGFGSDTVYGSRFADSLMMGDGNNFVVAGGGSDTVEVGSGSDTVSGDAGNDVIRFRAQAFGQADGDRDDYLSGGDGDDTLYGGAGADYLSGGAGRDMLFGDLSTSRNVAQSGDGNDTLLGGAGDDSLFGAGGADFLDGGVGNDFLNGGAGSDILRGGAGNDTLVVDSAMDFAAGDSGLDWLLVPVRASKMSYSGLERLTKY
jgi:Ca2+-binding RTX toxin-like protein